MTPSNGNGKVEFVIPPWGDRLAWNGKKWINIETPKGFPILNRRDKFRAFAWAAFFIADAALVIVTAYRIYRLMVKE